MITLHNFDMLVLQQLEKKKKRKEGKERKVPPTDMGMG